VKNEKKIDDYEVIIMNPEAIPIFREKIAEVAARLYLEGKIKIPQREKEAV
jgi:hypothetical protein